MQLRDGHLFHHMTTYTFNELKKGYSWTDIAFNGGCKGSRILALNSGSHCNCCSLGIVGFLPPTKIATFCCGDFML